MKAWIAMAVASALAQACVPHCDQPSDCIGGDVCAADGACSAPNELVTAHVTWTVQGQPASSQTCAGASLLVGFVVGFGRDQIEYDFGPVPCGPGFYIKANLPSFEEVEVGYDLGDSFGHGQFATPDSSSQTSFDLPAQD
jgi:hypothetical protein